MKRSPERDPGTEIVTSRDLHIAPKRFCRNYPEPLEICNGRNGDEGWLLQFSPPPRPVLRHVRCYHPNRLQLYDLADGFTDRDGSSPSNLLKSPALSLWRRIYIYIYIYIHIYSLTHSMVHPASHQAGLQAAFGCPQDVVPLLKQ